MLWLLASSSCILTHVGCIAMTIYTHTVTKAPNVLLLPPISIYIAQLVRRELRGVQAAPGADVKPESHTAQERVCESRRPPVKCHHTGGIVRWGKPPLILGHILRDSATKYVLGLLEPEGVYDSPGAVIFIPFVQAYTNICLGLSMDRREPCSCIKPRCWR